MPVQLKLEGPLPCEDELPTDLGPDDIGRVWWIDIVWHIWMGDTWRKAIATRTAP